MKRILSVLLVALFCFSAYGCSESDNVQDGGTTPAAEIAFDELIGEWIEVNGKYTMSISDSQIKYRIVGKSTGTTGGTTSGRGNYENGVLTLGSFEFGDLQAKKEGDTIKLVGSSCEFVTTAYYNNSVTQLSLKQTASTDWAELTVNSLTFSDTVSKYNLNPEGDGYWTGDHGQTFACFDFVLANNSKSKYELREIVEFSIDYNNGYMYGEEMNGSYADKINAFGYWYNNGGASSGPLLELEPLDETQYRGCIKCPMSISEDNAPLKIIVKLRSSTGFETFEYIVR